MATRVAAARIAALVCWLAFAWRGRDKYSAYKRSRRAHSSGVRGRVRRSITMRINTSIRPIDGWIHVIPSVIR
jgi:hypothetical protein